MGFRFKYMLGGGVVYLNTFPVAKTDQIKKGDFCGVAKGDATNNPKSSFRWFGVAAIDADGDCGESVKLYPPDSVYAIEDNKKRNCFDMVDINNEKNGITDDSCDDDPMFVIVRNSTETEDTLATLNKDYRVF